MQTALNAAEFNPLIARKNQSRNLRLAAIAVAALAAATLLLSAAVSAEPKVALKPALVAETSIQQVSVGVAQAKPARQVRVIPLWNTPKD